MSLQIKVGADVTGLDQGLRTAEARMHSFERAANNLSRTSVSATGALTGVSRIVQDLPYGFNSIANNITELPNLFASVSKAAKETGQSVGSMLLKSLKGVGGFGLILSGVTSALTIATVGLGAWTRGLGGASAASKQAAEEAKKHKEALDAIFEETAKEVSRVGVLVDLFQRESTSRKEKVNIIKELQSIAPGYFAQLDAEQTSISQLTNAYDRYTAGIRKAINAKVIEKQLIDVTDKRLKLERELDEVNQPFKDVVINGKLVRAKNLVLDTDGNILQIQKEINKSLKLEYDLTKRLATLSPEQIKPGDFKAPKKEDLTGFAKAIQDLLVVSPAIRFSDFDTKNEELQKVNQTVSGFFSGKIYKLKLQPVIDSDTQGLPLKDESIPVFTDNGQFNRLGGILGQEFVDSFNNTLQPPSLDISLAIAQQVDKAKGQIASKFNALGSAFGTAFGDIFQKIVNSKITSNSSQEQISQAFGQASNTVAALDLTVTSLSNSFDTFFDSILAGQNVFSSFGQLVSNTLKQIAVQLLKTIVLAGILSLITGGAAGGGLSFGQAFGKLFGGFRAGGGGVDADKGYIVGEQGPEWFQPGVAGRIIPNHQMNFGRNPGIQSGGAMQVVVSGYISGNGLRLVQARSDRQGRRLYGQ